ncbi:MAG: hypothetical protein LC808_41710 [Actinobacteria bacterium]|nr:hypothetical protein [Actinomycetota bacterium]
MSRRAPVPAEHLVHGLDAPVVLVSGRVAAWLLSRARLDQYHRTHRGDDAEVDQTLLALRSPRWVGGHATLVPTTALGQRTHPRTPHPHRRALLH